MTLLPGASDFYETYPPKEHAPGDLWSALPTYGVLPDAYCPGVVLTPACDLANRKVHTLTYLPVVSVSRFVCSDSMLDDVIRHTERHLTAAHSPIRLRSGRESPVEPGDLIAVRDLVLDTLSSAGGRRRESLSKAILGLDLAIRVVEGGPPVDSAEAFKSLAGDRDYDSTMSRMVTNALRSDVHFLPPDGLRELRVVQSPAVALFRYPLTIPIVVLDRAAECDAGSWDEVADSLVARYPCVRHMRGMWPLKTLRVRQTHVVDLITRFTSLYSRLGSPDFPEATVARYVNEIGEAR